MRRVRHDDDEDDDDHDDDTWILVLGCRVSQVVFSPPALSPEVFYTLVIGVPALVVAIAVVVAVVLLSALTQFGQHNQLFIPRAFLIVLHSLPPFCFSLPLYSTVCLSVCSSFYFSL